MKTGTALAAGTAALASFVHELSYAELPREVVLRTEDLFLDWIGSALAGKDSRPVTALARFAEIMGPASGDSEMLPIRRRNAPYFAASVECRCLARRRARRRSQRFRVSPRDGGVSSGAGHRAAVGVVGRGLHRRRGRRIRSRHPCWRGSWPLALHGLSYHRNGWNLGRRRSGRQNCCNSTAHKLWTRLGRRARRPRDCGSFCAMPPIPSNSYGQGRRRWIARRLHRPRRLHRRRAHRGRQAGNAGGNVPRWGRRQTCRQTW